MISQKNKFQKISKHNPDVGIITKIIRGSLLFTDLVEALLHNPVAARVGDVLKEPQDAVGVDPAVGAVYGAVGVAMLLAELAAQRLEPEEPVGALVRLDVVLQVGVGHQAGGHLHRHDRLGVRGRGGGEEGQDGSLLAKSMQ